MKNFFFTAASCFIFFIGHGQNVVQLPVSGLHFNSIEEQKVFEAVSENQTCSSVRLFMVIDSAITENEIQTVEKAIGNFAAQMEAEKPARTFGKTVQNYFDETHKKFFKKYQLSAFFNQIFEGGTYNCVTASALYAIIFDKLGINYAIKEKPTHVYLIVNPGKENILVESTDPEGRISGVSDDFKKKYVNFLKAEKLLSEKEIAAGSIDDVFYKSYYTDSNVTLIQLAGIQYYNKGVDLVQNNRYGKALSEFEKSYRLYPQASTSFLIISCLENLLGDDFVRDYDARKEYLVKYVNYTHLEQVKQNATVYYEKIADELLINQNDEARYQQFHSYLLENITDTSVKNEINFIHYYYLGTAAGLKSDFSLSITNLKQAASIHPNNLRIHSLTTEMVLKQLYQNRDLDEEDILDSVNYYVAAFPFLSDNKTFQILFTNIYLHVAGTNFNRNKGETGAKYLSSFEAYYKEHPGAELDDKMIVWGYGEASSYFVRKGNKAKARELLETGMKYSPNDERLKTKMSYLKYF